MRKIFTALMIAGACSVMAVQPMRINLHDGWQVGSSADGAASYAATVPSTAMGVLMANGVYPADLLDGENYRTVDRTQFDVPWWWRTDFELPALGPGSRVRLDLDGITYRADVWLNGSKIASADTLMGPFRLHSLDITSVARAGKNRLEILVSRARDGEPNIGFVDWNPRPADESMGVFRPVWVTVTGPVEITRPAVRSRVNKETLDEAWLTAEARLTNGSDAPVRGTLTARVDGRTVSRHVELAAGESRTVRISADEAPELHILHPRLWWCRNMGAPEMYTMEMEFTPDGAAAASDRTSVDFGIREVEDYFTPEGHRGFRLNGRPVLVRSAGWTDDIFLRNDSARNEAEIALVCGMNLNSVRFENVWGTSQHIYDLCDRNGLLVFTGWSCHWEWDNYLGSPCDEFGGIRTEADMDLIARSLADQVAWLRNHPSIIAWFTGSDMLPRPALERRYIDAMRGLDDRPMITAAKAMVSELSGPSGTKMAGPYEYVAPNYWYAPEAPGGAFGWNTETGIGAQLPQRESLMRMIPADRLWPAGDAWSYHCTASAGNMDNMDTLLSVVTKRLGAPVGFDDFVRKAEWINYDGTRTMFEAFRARIPRATGIVQWMLNSAWPSLYWQLYDHYLQPTSAYYALRRSNEPVQLIYDYGRRAVVVVNETLEPAALTARMERYSLDGTLLGKAERAVTAAPYEVGEVFADVRPEGLEMVFLTLLDGDSNAVAENFYALSPDEDRHDWERSDWTGTPVAHHADFSALASLPAVAVDSSVERVGDTLRVHLANPGPGIAFFVRVAALDAAGRLQDGALWSDNYLTLRPGETRTITCTLPAGASTPTVVIN